MIEGEKEREISKDEFSSSVVDMTSITVIGNIKNIDVVVHIVVAETSKTLMLRSKLWSRTLFRNPFENETKLYLYFFDIC
jgi:hypothetical protein